ncbi:Uncharacterised protein [uncultured archaeon]|nr:Uncharacterised protein [uncultured archaeon]
MQRSLGILGAPVSIGSRIKERSIKQSWLDSLVHSLLIFHLRILVILYSIEESFDRFGVAPDFDDPGFFDFIEMVIVCNQNRISIKAGRSVNDI